MDAYTFHQTPASLGRELMEYISPHLSPTDVLYEPFRGEGAFYNNFPSENPKHWTEIVEGRDFRDFAETYDWVITNPPFRIDNGTNAMWFLLDYFTSRAKKGVAFLVNDQGISTMTPRRREMLRAKGWDIVDIVVAQVRKWRGRYYFIIVKPSTTTCLHYLTNTY